MATNTQTDPQSFNRDFQLGDTGDDVARLQGMLALLGYSPSEEEVRKKQFGQSTLDAASKLREDAAKNPILSLFAKMILQFVFQMDPEELDPTESRGTGQRIRNYRSDDNAHLFAIEAGTLGSKGAGRAAELATRFIGEREEGNNCGPVVQHFTGTQGVPWCGGFVKYVMDHSISPALYSQSNPLSALGFAEHAKHFGAFREPNEGYAPKVGDVVVFGRGAGKGHVGIVTGIDANGTLTYVAGNDGNAVRARTFDLHHPPQSLVGFSDTHALAKAKHIAMEQDVAVIPAAKLQVHALAHSDKAFARG